MSARSYEVINAVPDAPRHPVIGALAGLALALGAALLLFVYGVVPMTVGWLFGLLLVGALFGIVAAYVTPPLQPRGGQSRSR